MKDYFQNILKKSVKFRIGSLLWGMFSGAGVKPFIWLHGKVNIAMYKNIIELHDVPSLKISSASNHIFM